MTDTNQIRIKFPEGGCWIAKGLGMTVGEPDVQSFIAGNSAQRELIELIQPVIDAEPGDMPSTLGENEWVFAGWDGDVAVYAQNIEKTPASTLKAHRDACEKARREDAYEIQQQYMYDTLDEAYTHLPSINEYVERTAVGANPRLTVSKDWVNG